MRVISGSARGKKLLPVPGMDTRPTTDRVKESVFNILQFQVYNARVLDLFAGTGQMGIEALSRGASRCVFVDHAPVAIEVIGKNVKAARVEDKAVIQKTDYVSFLSGCREKFDILFLDPPYGGKVLNHALKIVEKFDILDSDGIIICESNVEDEIQVPEGFAVRKTYRYGTIQLMKLDRG